MIDMKKRSIDIIRLIATYLVVAIHISPFEKINPAFDLFFTRILGRLAVPLFFMITGYYILSKSLKEIQTLKEYTKKILIIYFISILIYLPINFYTGSWQSMNIIDFLKEILIDGTFYHLWYFTALILALWLVYFLVKKLGNKKILAIVSFLYLIGLFGDSYYGFLNSSPLLTKIYDILFLISTYTRNGLFYAPIFLYLGYEMKKATKESSNHDLIISLCLFLGMTLEGFLLHFEDMPRHDSMYLLLVPLMYFLFRYLITHNNTSYKEIRKIATFIYILHPLMIIMIRFIAGIFKLETILVDNNLILYLVVCLATTILAIIIEKSINLIKKIKINASNPKQIK